MKISSKFVGMEFRPHKRVVNWRDTMNYAAAVDDNNPHYFDDEKLTGIIAPPMFSVAVTWPIVQNLSNYLNNDDFPIEILKQQVHYSEHLVFHRPIKPGDELLIRGKITAILPHRAGTHIVLRFDAVDQQGEAVFTEHFGGIMRGVSCEDEGKGGNLLPAVPQLSVSTSPLWQQSISISKLAAHVYDGCTHIFFPIHTSRRFARQVGLPDILLQGTATLAYASRELVNRHADGDPARLTQLNCRFTGMVIPGTDITIQLLDCVDEQAFTALYFQVLGTDGSVVIKDGYALISNIAQTD